MEEIYENTSATITLAFFNENGVAVVPDTATFILFDKFSGSIIRSGSIGSLATTVDFIINIYDTNILDQYNKYEIKVLEVEFTYVTLATTYTGRGTYEFRVNNLTFSPSTLSSSSSSSSSYSTTP